jgi:hypothetical protein
VVSKKSISQRNPFLFLCVNVLRFATETGEAMGIPKKNGSFRRVLDELNRLKLPVSTLANAEACKHCPELVRAGTVSLSAAIFF